jgi:hypothetical protein
MAVEEVNFTLLLRFRIYRSLGFPQEFSIEIPDAEADSIQTVQQGEFLDCGSVLHF